MSPALEKRGLRVSIGGNLLMVVLGFWFALTTSSNAVLLDGVYSLIGLVMALLAGKIASLVDRGPNRRFPFGYMHFEPLFNSLRSLLIVVISLFAFVSAFLEAASGGRAINSGQALIYGVICTVSCLGISWYQRALCKKTLSPLMVLDSRSWMIDGVLSATATAAFLVAIGLQYTPWNAWAVYVDPLLVMVLVAVMIPVPVKLLAQSLKEVLQTGPRDRLRRELESRVKSQVDHLDLACLDIRMVRIGRFFYVLIYLVTPDKEMTVGQADEIRQDIADALPSSKWRLLLDVVFTTQEKWLQENQTAV